MQDKLAVFFDEWVLAHDTGSGFFESSPSPFLEVMEKHPENDDRLRNIRAVLQNGPIAQALSWHGAGPASRGDLLLFHEADYIDYLEGLPQDTASRLTGTTVWGPGTWTIAKVAAGLAIGAARHVWRGAGQRAYALVRPPGHHAQPGMADGYCFINNIGVALQALRQEGLKRACVIDWDVHHGNGTQEGFYQDPDVLTISLHMNHGAWGGNHPQSGAADEVGGGPGRGTNLNVPLPYGSGDQAYCRAFDEIVAPAVEKFAPELLFIAAGQDANQFDPNGRQLVTMAGFHQLGRRARALADRLCGGKLVLVQEGGYAVSYAAYCLHATLEGVLGRDPGLDDPIAFMPEHTQGLDAALRRIQETHASALTEMDSVAEKSL
ncbi:MAG: class II histone deacetylase [Pseudomonadota bacterium]